MPLRPSRLPDSSGIFTFSNGVRMEEISRSVRQAKQAKFLVLTVQSVQSDVAGPHRPYDHTMVMWHSVVGCSLTSDMMTRVTMWLAYMFVFV